MSETLNCALLDTSCSANICGINWLQCYVDSLPTDVDLQETNSCKVFNFGAGDTYQSLKQVNIPVSIAGMDACTRTDVVDCKIPLLLLKGSLKDADAQSDFVNDNITMYGKEINLQHTSNGHYCIPLTPKQLAVTIYSRMVVHLLKSFLLLMIYQPNHHTKKQLWLANSTSNLVTLSIVRD